MDRHIRQSRTGEFSDAGLRRPLGERRTLAILLNLGVLTPRAEFLGKLTELLGMQALCLLGFLLRFFPLRGPLETLAQHVRRMFAVRVVHVAGCCAIEIESRRRLLHRFQILHSAGMKAERDAQRLFIHSRHLRVELFINPDGKRFSLLESRKSLANLFQQCASSIDRVGSGSQCIHQQQ